MAKPRPPKVDASKIDTDYSDPLQNHLRKAYFRNINFIEALARDEISESWLAFETLIPIIQNLCDGSLTHDDIKSCYPEEKWREETVEVPAELLALLVMPFIEFKDKEHKTLEQCFGFKNMSGNTGRSMRTISKKLDNDIKIAAEVDGLYTDIGTGARTSLETAIADVAERNATSFDTVKRAYKKFGQHAVNSIKNEFGA